MMKAGKWSLLLVLGLMFSALVHAGEAQVVCEGWYQQDAKEKLERVQMPLVEATEKHLVFSLENRGYQYRVDWDRQLTTFYVTIGHEGKRILFTTARVPTPEHPENFTDLNLPDGPRLSVNCEQK
jgi:hypothetical protein